MPEIDYTQFKQEPPKGLTPKPKFTLEQLKEKLQRDINLKTIIVSLNCHHFRSNEIHINTADIGCTYIPDFDFTDYDELDPWKRIWKLKYNMQQFDDIKMDFIRCEDFLHKMQVCEALTLFEEVHRMLRDGGTFQIKVVELLKVAKEIIDHPNQNSAYLYDAEKLLFSGSDSTGQFYNRTIWTQNRFKVYLGMAHFTDLEFIEEGKFNLIVKAKK